MQDAMKAYSGMEDKYRYSAISSMYPSAEAVAAAAAKYMQEAAGKSYLDSGNARYFDSGTISPNKHFTPSGKYVPLTLLSCLKMYVSYVAEHEMRCENKVEYLDQNCLKIVGQKFRKSQYFYPN